VDQDDFRRRIEVYLELDLPNLSERGSVAEVLSERLWQYVRQPAPREPAVASDLLRVLLPRDKPSVLLFDAAWNGGTPGHAQVVRTVADEVGAAMLEIDVDDPVGGAIAAALGVVTVPTLALVDEGRIAVTRAGAQPADAIREGLNLTS
jgi:hypothetical protein